MGSWEFWLTALGALLLGLVAFRSFRTQMRDLDARDEEKKRREEGEDPS